MRDTYIDDAISTRLEASLNELVVSLKVAPIQSSPDLAVDEVLPPDWQPEHVHAVILVKVLHLSGSVTSVRVLQVPGAT